MTRTWHSFSRIIGHEPIRERLLRAHAAGRLAHAYLFYGPRGVGKASFAEALAMGLQCEKGLATACETCPGCRRVLSGNHPDVSLIEKSEGSRDIKIDQVRTGIRELSFKPSEGPVKVLILDGAERMGLAAGNALLKILEEPPPHSHLLLVTERRSALLETIVSRCQPVRFGRLATEDLARALVEREGMLEARAKRLARLSGGSYERAIELGDENLIRQTEAVLDMVLQTEKDPFGRARQFLSGLEDSKTLEARRNQIREALELLCLYLRDLRVLQTGGTPIFHADRLERLKAEADRFAPGAVDEAFWFVIEQKALIDRNLHPDTLVETLVLELDDRLTGDGETSPLELPLGRS